MWALGDPDAGVRQAAAEALGRIGDDEAMTALESALHDASERVRRAARRALTRIGDD